MAGVTSQAAAVFSLVNEIFNRSINLIVAELRLQLNARAELNNLQRTLLRTHSLLEEAKARRMTDKSLVLWLMELKEWAYDADDILDEYEAAAIRLKVTRSTFKRLIDHVIINVPLAHKVADVRKRLNGVTLERELNLGALEGSQPLDATKRGVTTSLLTESCIVGRAQDKENLIRLLLEPSDGAVPVVPIVGLGGAGKTTLSQLIFNDKRVEEHFPLRMWVCVSDDFDVKRITREITEYATNGRLMDLTNLNMLQVNLKEEIRGTTFLLVLDDVWNEDPVKWESLLAPLDAGGRGSVVIVTTQSKKVADVTGTMEPYVLEDYNVDKKKGHGIAELSAMNQLHGGLSIRNLQNVEKTRESRKARLDEKQKLKLLELRWADGRGAGECDRDRKVLKGLRPHPNLRELSIKYYGGTSSPSWMTDQYLPNMETIRLRSCARLTELPCLGQLHLLRHLHIDGMSQARQINLQFYGTGEVSGFPLLELLNICRMPRLEEWSEPRRNCCYFPRLHKLLIEDCPRLRNLPSLPPTLEELRISRTGLVDLPGFHGNGDVTTNVSLSSLHVSECRELRSLSEGLLQHHLVALKTAAFTDCDSLEFLPAEGFRTAISLESLIMTNCPLPSSFLLPSSLEHLKLQPCLYPNNNEDSLSTCFENLTSLSFLDIKDCPNLSSFPPGPQCQLSALQHLSLVNCQRLQSIGFQALTSLESLTIQNCPRLTMSHSLVEVNNSSDTGLAFNITRWMRRRTGDDGLMLRHRVQNDSFFGGLLQHLTFLQFLKICQCPQLVTFTGEEEEKWRNLTSLQILHIVDCPNLEVLPANLQSLCSLSTLYIVRCPRIHAFPPGGVSMSLAHLVIHECPQLCQRCHPPGGCSFFEEKVVYVWRCLRCFKDFDWLLLMLD
ncbi:unnamed protein product [Musa acuminata var. zebrina]